MQRFTAIEKVHEYLRNSADIETELEIIESETIDCSFGWMFFYRAKDCEVRLAGNAPLLFDSSNNSIISTGTSHAPEYYIRNYEVTGSPFSEPTHTVVIEGWIPGAQTIEAVRLIHRSTDLGLAKSKEFIDRALMNELISIDMPSESESVQLSSQLKDLGWKTKT